MANVTVRRMSPYVGGVIWLIIDGLGFSIIGSLSGAVWAAFTSNETILNYGFLGGIMLWLGFRLGNDLVVVRKQQFLVVERLGQLYAVKHDGLRMLLLRGLVDNIPPDGADTLAFQRYVIYNGQPGAEVDFRDASAPVTGSVWFAIGDPELKQSWNGWEQLNEQIVDWVYAYENSRERIFEVVDGFVRPLLQSWTLDEAQVETRQGEHGSIANHILNNQLVIESLREFGAFFDPRKPFILSDIDIPEPLQEAREARLVATARADADKETGRGIAEAISNIRPQLGDDGDKALAAFQTRIAQSVIKDKEGNVSFVASDVGGLTRTLEVGNVKKEE